MKSILKISTKSADGYNDHFPLPFTKYKDVEFHIDESKAPNWMDTKMKIKEVDFSIEVKPKMEKRGDYWSKENTSKITYFSN